MKRIVLLAAATLAGCVDIESLRKPLTSHYAGKDLSSVSSYDLCVDFNRSLDLRLIDEVRRRDDLSTEDVRALIDRTPAIGMSPLGALCMYGKPKSVNDTTTAAHRHEQWVYCQNYMLSPKLRPENTSGSWLLEPSTLRTMCGDHAYLYFDDGNLSAHQNVPR